MHVRLEVPTKGYDTTAPAIGGHGATTTLSGDVVEAMVLQRKRGRPLSLMDTHPRKKASSPQPNPFIINIRNSSHKVISDYSYVQESILRDASMIETSSKNNEISINYASMH
jgi:hypothetical protein